MKRFILIFLLILFCSCSSIPKGMILIPEATYNKFTTTVEEVNSSIVLLWDIIKPTLSEEHQTLLEAAYQEVKAAYIDFKEGKITQLDYSAQALGLFKKLAAIYISTLYPIGMR